MDVGKIIRELREQSGATQAEIAAKLGIARATYAALEDGREPKLGELRELSKLYDISLEDLVNGQISRKDAPDDIELNKPEIQPRDINPQFKPEKLREVLLYLTNKVGAKANVGETVLYKLLYFIDFDYYEKTGHSITGLTYVKLPHGPAPKPSTFSGVIAKMKHDQEIETVETKYFSFNQKKYLPLKSADARNLSNLTAAELEHINWEINRLSDKSAKELSEFSHYDTPWVVAKNNQPIKYRFVFYRGANTSVTEPEDEL
jgi:transcriptional regulator with XRE-family HTH domain